MKFIYWSSLNINLSIKIKWLLSHSLMQKRTFRLKSTGDGSSTYHPTKQLCVLQNHSVHTYARGKNLALLQILDAGLKLPAVLWLRYFLLCVFAENGLKFPSCCAADGDVLDAGMGKTDRNCREALLHPRWHGPPCWMQIRRMGSSSLLMGSHEKEMKVTTQWDSGRFSRQAGLAETGFWNSLNLQKQHSQLPLHPLGFLENIRCPLLLIVSNCKWKLVLYFLSHP